MDEFCFKCASPLHHRPECTEDIDPEEAKVTKREIRRLHEALNPAPENSQQTPPVHLTALNFILTKSYDFYFDCDSLLDHLGPAPVGNSKVVDENYQQHKALNYKIHEYRKTDDGMIPTLRKIKSSFFANDDEYNIFMARTLQVGELRSKVWEKTSKYLVWNHSARGVRANMVKLINETEILSIKHAELLLGRPKNIANSTVKARELDLKLQQLERYGHELKRICKTESIPLVDKRVAAIDMKVQPLILDLMNYNDLAARSEVDKMAVSLKELETEREQLDNMVTCNVCCINKKEYIIPCGHMLCGQCLSDIESKLRFEPLVNELFEVSEQDVRIAAKCPFCAGALKPRRRIFF